MRFRSSFQTSRRANVCMRARVHARYDDAAKSTDRQVSRVSFGYLGFLARTPALLRFERFERSWELRCAICTTVSGASVCTCVFVCMVQWYKGVQPFRSARYDRKCNVAGRTEKRTGFARLYLSRKDVYYITGNAGKDRKLVLCQRDASIRTDLFFRGGIDSTLRIFAEKITLDWSCVYCDCKEEHLLV